jgi:hypothetical protein
MGDTLQTVPAFFEIAASLSVMAELTSKKSESCAHTLKTGLRVTKREARPVAVTPSAPFGTLFTFITNALRKGA